MADRPLTDDDYLALARFRYALRVFLRFSEEAARGEGLTPNQHQLLLALRGFGADRPLSISDLAELLQLKQHSTLELVQRAVVVGIVRTVDDPDDGRRQLVELTADGSRRLAALSVLHRDELRRFRTEMGDVLRSLDDPPPRVVSPSDT
jgi:DNA-binding MarR family transcriptional regulator